MGGTLIFNHFRVLSLVWFLSFSTVAMSYSGPSQISVPKPSNEDENLKVYLTLLFFIPIFFIIILSFLCYFTCLRQDRITDSDWDSIERRVDLWLSRQVRETIPIDSNIYVEAELGLRRIVRDELPIVIFNKSLSLNDLKCSVCLEDYQEDEKLRKIGGCGHTFHMKCLDQWLPSNPTCPICRFPLHSIEIVSSTESQPTSEAVIHIDDGQEDIQEV